jgi:hypothetical protein
MVTYDEVRPPARAPPLPCLRRLRRRRRRRVCGCAFARVCPHARGANAQSQAKPSQAKPSQAKPSQAKPSAYRRRSGFGAQVGYRLSSAAAGSSADPYSTPDKRGRPQVATLNHPKSTSHWFARRCRSSCVGCRDAILPAATPRTAFRPNCAAPAHGGITGPAALCCMFHVWCMRACCACVSAWRDRRACRRRCRACWRARRCGCRSCKSRLSSSTSLLGASVREYSSTPIGVPQSEYPEYPNRSTRVPMSRVPCC